MITCVFDGPIDTVGGVFLILRHRFRASTVAKQRCKYLVLAQGRLDGIDLRNNRSWLHRTGT